MQPWDKVLDYWFAGEPDDSEPSESAGNSALWFAQNDEFDREIRAHFGEDLERARLGECDDWAVTARGRLGLIILL
ncbi:MAG: DUF924 family protein, partial [Myxococcota bacterium]